MTRRRAEIALLAGSLVDVSVVTSTWRGNPLCSAGEAPRGLAPFRTVVCDRCEGRGVVTDRFRREVECGGCDGAGRFAVDGYTGERVGTAETATVVRMRSSLCDRCGGTGVYPAGRRCPTCDGAGRREWSPFELRGVELPGEARAEDGSGLLARPRELARLYAAGSYAELERALSRLAGVNVRAHRLWVNRHVAGVGVELDEAGVYLLERSWRFVDAAMPDPVRVPGDIRAAARRQPGAQLAQVRGRHAPSGLRAERDREMRRLFSIGEQDIAGLIRWSGLSRRQVTEIIYGGEEAA